MTWFSDKLLSARVYPDSQSQRPSVDPPGGPGLIFPLPGGSVSRQDSSKSRASASGGVGGGSRGFGGSGGAGGEVDEESKKNQNIINIVREGQISLLVRISSYFVILLLITPSSFTLHNLCVFSSLSSLCSLTWQLIIWSWSETRMETTCSTSRPLRATPTVCSISHLWWGRIVSMSATTSSSPPLVWGSRWTSVLDWVHVSKVTCLYSSAGRDSALMTLRRQLWITSSQSTGTPLCGVFRVTQQCWHSAVSSCMLHTLTAVSCLSGKAQQKCKKCVYAASALF